MQRRQRLRTAPETFSACRRQQRLRQYNNYTNVPIEVRTPIHCRGCPCCALPAEHGFLAAALLEARPHSGPAA